MKTFYLLFILFVISSCQAQEAKPSYSNFLDSIKLRQEAYQKAFSEASSAQKDSITHEARRYLNATLSEELLPYWYGTPWDFDGTTRVPQQGKIACGYFVTNTLTDLGFDIPRVKWAQSASEVFIKKLAFGDVKRFHHADIASLDAYLHNKGNGLYLTGLDMHTGFVLVSDNDIQFIHADYYEPEIGVTSETLDADGPMANSAYRVFGKLFSDEMMAHWLTGEAMN